MKRSVFFCAAALILAGCTLPQPYSPPSTPPPPPPPTGQAPSVETRPAEPPVSTPEPEPLPPAPVVRERTLTPASRALVTQAQAQTASRNFPMAAASIERALRIEPDNPLLWIELGRVRQAEGNYPQAENMGRKAVAMASGDARTQSSAWSLIADSYRGRGRNQEAREAEARASALSAR